MVKGLLADPSGDRSSTPAGRGLRVRSSALGAQREVDLLLARTVDRSGVTVGRSQRFGLGQAPPVHLLIAAVGRDVLADIEGQAKDRRPVLLPGVREERSCSICRSFWKRTSSVQNICAQPQLPSSSLSRKRGGR